MKSKILIMGLIATIVIVAVFLVLQKEDIKIHDVDEAFSLLKENYSISNDYSVINITNTSNDNGWRFEFLKIEGNCSLECIEKHIYFEVYKNSTVIKSGYSTNVTKLENENDALNYVLYKFPEFKNISKCEFEEKLMCHEDITVERIDNGWNITFINETKGCNNECVIEHYYSFVVEKDGNVIRDVERKRTVTLEGILSIFGRKMEYPEGVESIPYDITWRLFRWGGLDGWCERLLTNNVQPHLNWWICSSPPSKESVLVFINEDKKIVYKMDKNISYYNILLEKFSTKTINNESDVLEAFERYLELFQLECYRIKYSKDGKKERGEYIMYKFYHSESFKEFTDKMKCKTYKKNNSWMLECEINSCISRDWIEGKWKARISENGGVYIVEKDIGVIEGACLIL